MRKLLAMLLTMIIIAVIAGCGTEQKVPSTNAGIEVDKQTYPDESETSSYDDEPIYPGEAYHPNFNETLQAQTFPALVNSKVKENLSNLSAEQAFEWVKEAELTYQTTMYRHAAYTEEQRAEILSWLQNYMSEEVIQQRAGKAFHPVEGGYRIIAAYYFQDFNIVSIENVVHLDVKQKDNVTTLIAELVVMVEQPITVVYKITTTDGVSKLTGYQFELGPVNYNN
ncbi:hypothetical protein [Paenibacillus paeoniae]|uniref:Uncharacterized protein n=1 Tax=Paenibacillus paeoniae TaxID=2292705 RepID=A0A371NZT6_9BACL|nr:hypothetical protein [Paenibacillus paeoniae]REK69179.1 hypothetical protein DX130_25970 [Paenibacillus paeoniae]